MNQGFKPTEAEMVSWGIWHPIKVKVSISWWKPLSTPKPANSNDSKSSVFAPVKEDKVKFTFKGVEQQVDFTANSIRNYILSLGDAEGVSGGMSNVSETLGGKISNIGDAWERWMNTLGSSRGGILSWIADKIIDLVEDSKRQ